MAGGGILVLDYGTTCLKAALYDENLRAVAERSYDWKYSYPRQDFIEYPAEEYFEAALSLMRELLAGEGAGALTAISVTGQAETLIGVDRAGRAVGEAIVWLDTRAQRECADLAGRVSEDYLYEKTGNTGFDPVMPACKIPWIRDNQPDRYAATETFLLIKEFIIYRLTGMRVGEYSALSCSGYFDIVARRYDGEILAAAGIDAGKLPEPAPSLEIVGELRPEVARSLGLGPGVKVVNGMLDQCASAIGAGNIHPGMVTETTGTVLALAATMTAFEPGGTDERMLVLCHALDKRFLALPNCPTAGVLLNWFRDQFLSADEWREDGDPFRYISRMVEGISPRPDGPVVLPHFSGRLSPVHSPEARGAIIGLRLDTGKFDIARAVMESVGFMLRENLELLARQGIEASSVTSLGGGAKSDVWLGIKASIIGLPVVTLMDGQSTSLGCAVGAALATGMIKDVDDIVGMNPRRAEYLPDDGEVRIYGELYEKYLKLNRDMGYG